MYVILVNDDNTLLTSQKSRIMQRSKLVDELWFLASQTYNGYSMADCTVLLEYVLPVSREYHTEILTLSEELYEKKLKYLVPVDTKLTAEPGDIEVQLSFVYSDLDEDGSSIQRVRKTSSEKITIVPITAWSDIIPDSALTALDQRIIKMDAQIKAINDANKSINKSKADNLSYDEDTNAIQLTADGKPIGDKVQLRRCEADENGTPVVDLSSYAGDYDGEEDGDQNATKVVRF